ncbi:DUF1853 family protein [Noviherbaspirillum sp.]|uniref:DUF1853 family protein n=1 Tax=Noviherbaspirillum sp. TaxID=1926288 RepID=UPI002D31C6DC|nr:DUF1853 family protein [Noviherbaspirillum sp.]HZW23439.1 DUF1853 family protein [Noviherbaspirillum sp.]
MQTPDGPQTYQEHFHQRWNFLTDPHVRTLAWLLDAPDLLDAAAAEWQGKIASIGPLDQRDITWLRELDRNPQALHDYLAIQPLTRLGRYAEKLMACYLEHSENLFAHGVQVRTEKNETVGEFDFLLRRGQGLVHWEFATKLYLLESSGRGRHADYFVGPNLADTLGVKVRKIMDRQLSLSQHPAAATLLPMPVTSAEALVKGWLFYQGRTPEAEHPQGVSHAHCRGFWCALQETEGLDAEAYAILPRLSWLAPARLAGGEGMDKEALRAKLEAHFHANSSPVLVALLRREGGVLLETDRGFVVPDDWRSRAEIRVRRETTDEA